MGIFCFSTREIRIQLLWLILFANPLLSAWAHAGDEHSIEIDLVPVAQASSDYSPGINLWAGNLTYPEHLQVVAESGSPFPVVPEENYNIDEAVSIPEISAYAIIFGGTVLLLVLGRRYLR